MTTRTLVGAIATAALLGLGGPAGAAVTSENFQVKNAQDLVDLCGVERSDPVASQAIHFCEGYLTGVYHYHQGLVAGRRLQPVFCPTGTLPTRDEAVQMFVTWGHSHPQFMTEPAIDTIFRWASETWPCRRTNRRATP